MSYGERDLAISAGARRTRFGNRLIDYEAVPAVRIHGQPAPLIVGHLSVVERSGRAGKFFRLPLVGEWRTDMRGHCEAFSPQLAGGLVQRRCRRRGNTLVDAIEIDVPVRRPIVAICPPILRITECRCFSRAAGQPLQVRETV
jgi:hypothetical protein